MGGKRGTGRRDLTGLKDEKGKLPSILHRQRYSVPNAVRRKQSVNPLPPNADSVVCKVIKEKKQKKTSVALPLYVCNTPQQNTPQRKHKLDDDDYINNILNTNGVVTRNCSATHTSPSQRVPSVARNDKTISCDDDINVIINYRQLRSFITDNFVCRKCKLITKPECFDQTTCGFACTI